MAVELILRPDLGKRPLRLKCRFKVEPQPSPRQLELAKNHCADLFVQEMAKQGFAYMSQFQFRITGPYVFMEPSSPPSPKRLRAKDMLPQVAQGARFLDEGETGVQEMPAILYTEYWEYELSAVFLHDTIMGEYALPHEEKEAFTA